MLAFSVSKMVGSKHRRYGLFLQVLIPRAHAAAARHSASQPADATSARLAAFHSFNHQVENVGVPTFERADPHQVAAGQVQRYHASLAELDEHSRPLVTEGPPLPVAPPLVVSSGGGGPTTESAEAHRRHEQRL